jgi:uracil-DNA glycosylase
MSNKREITNFFSPAGKRTRREQVEIESVPSFPSLEENETTELESKGITSPPSEEAKEEVPPFEVAIKSNNQRTEAPLFDLGSWSDLLQNEFTKTYFRNLMRYVDGEYKTATVYPPREQIFSAFTTCDLDQLKVVIIGQDPYHGPNQAHGLSFSVLEGNAPPPSLRNIFKEARVSPSLLSLSFSFLSSQTDVGITQPKHGNLTCWSRQGVFLLNNVLTVRRSEPNSHQNKGWEEFTDAVIRELNKRDRLIFILWGKPAQTKGKSINTKKHLVITSSHPSPLGATKTKEPFIGSRCFSRCNTALTEMGKDPINWEVN